MKRILLAVLLLFVPILPAHAYWEYGHQTVAQIAEANMSAKARNNMNSLMQAVPMVGTPKCSLANIKDASIWADCIKGDNLRWGYTNSWHYQNVDICKPFDLKSACANGNCVSAQIDRNFALLKNKNLPAHVRLEAMAFLIHFVGDLHQPLHAGDRSDRGGNDLKVIYGIMPGYNLHSVWDGLLADRALSAPPSLIRHYTVQEKTALQSGTALDWSRESWQISRDIAYSRALDSDACAPPPKTPVTIDEADVAASRKALRGLVIRGGLRLARLLNEALE